MSVGVMKVEVGNDDFITSEYKKEKVRGKLSQ
jgi:hypothetical protein